MKSKKSLEMEIESIKSRNKRVEAEKAWETSLTRKLIISALTYFVMSVFFFFAGLPNPFINSIVPALAFILSTLSLGFFKNLWKEHIYKK